jgi:hypothetical protein
MITGNRANSQRWSKELPMALRAGAKTIETGAKYEWGHVGRCNCGHLVQQLTGKNDREIFSSFDGQLCEWTESALRHKEIINQDAIGNNVNQLQSYSSNHNTYTSGSFAVGDEALPSTEAMNDYCGVTMSPLEELYTILSRNGLTVSDIRDIEYLSNETVLRTLPIEYRNLRRNEPEHVAMYMRAMADCIEEQLI